MTNKFPLFIIKSLVKSHEKKEYIPAELSERGRLVGEPQKRRMEAVFSVCFTDTASRWKVKKYTAAYAGVNGFE